MSYLLEIIFFRRKLWYFTCEISCIAMCVHTCRNEFIIEQYCTDISTLSLNLTFTYMYSLCMHIIAMCKKCIRMYNRVYVCIRNLEMSKCSYSSKAKNLLFAVSPSLYVVFITMCQKKFTYYIG